MLNLQYVIQRNITSYQRIILTTGKSIRENTGGDMNTGAASCNHSRLSNF